MVLGIVLFSKTWKTSLMLNQMMFQFSNKTPIIQTTFWVVTCLLGSATHLPPLQGSPERHLVMPQGPRRINRAVIVVYMVWLYVYIYIYTNINVNININIYIYIQIQYMLLNIANTSTESHTFLYNHICIYIYTHTLLIFLLIWQSKKRPPQLYPK